MAKGTLNRQLVTRISAIVAAIAIALSALSAVMVQRILTEQVDQQLSQALGMESKSTSQSARGSAPLGGLPVDSVVVLVGSDGTTRGTLESVDRTKTTQTSDEVNDEISQVNTDGNAHQVRLSDLGTYRVMSRDVTMTITDTDGSTSTSAGTLYVGIPMQRWTAVMRKLLLAESVLTLFAIAAAAAIATAVVRSSLRPLNRLAKTATEVSKMDLGTGEVILPPRIPDAEASPDNEVGRVGLSFNHMLDNVEGALVAREKSETKVKQFVADASHELRNPLAAIRGYAELSLKHRDALSPDTAFAMGRIDAESRRMGGLVEDMLLLARLDAGRNVELLSVDVVEIVLNAVSDARVSGPDHRWQLSLPEDSVMVLADSNQLHQVVANLLSNARKHTPAETTVTTSVMVDGADAVITVEDNGPGVPEEIRDQVFERFARADAARTHDEEGSTGLGLAIVAAVMRAHHGSATVDSHPGYSCFTLRLPLENPPAQPDADTNPAQAPDVPDQPAAKQPRRSWRQR